jgi:hypothetical protein
MFDNPGTKFLNLRTQTLEQLKPLGKTVAVPLCVPEFVKPFFSEVEVDKDKVVAHYVAEGYGIDKAISVDMAEHGSRLNETIVTKQVGPHTEITVIIAVDLKERA